MLTLIFRQELAKGTADSSARRLGKTDVYSYDEDSDIEDDDEEECSSRVFNNGLSAQKVIRFNTLFNDSRTKIEFFQSNFVEANTEDSLAINPGMKNSNVKYDVSIPDVALTT